MSTTATTNAFGLNFASSISAAALIVNDESQLLGTTNQILINNQNLGPLSSSLASSSICSNSNSSSIGSCNSSSMKLETANSSSTATMAAGTIDTTTSNPSITMVSPVNNNNNTTNGNVNSSPPPTQSSSTIIAASSSSSPSSFKAASASSTAAASSSSSAVTANNNYESTHSRLIAGYPRLSGLYSSTYAAAAAAATAHPEASQAAAAAASSAFYQTNGASFYPSLNSHYDLDKSSGNSWTPLASQASYSPYDAAAAAHHSFYGPYSNCYGAIDSAARRKNATRETTNTLKAWLYEHRKNPYPTKGEKIMLAIITKMTLTQVSTWFANARRRLKKENKMTWEPKNKSTDSLRDNDSDKDSQKDLDEDSIIINKNGSSSSLDNGNGLRIKSNHHEQQQQQQQQQQPRGHNGGHIGGGQSAAAAAMAPISGIGTNHHMSKGHLLSNHHGQVPPTATVQHSQTPAFGLPLEGDNTMDGQRPKIWSLAQTATNAEASAAAAAAAAAASLAGRLYPSEWSAAAYAAQFQSPSMSENLSLINPLTEHYHNHPAHHNNHGGTATNQSVGHLNHHHLTSHHNQSPPTNSHVQSPINSHAQPPPPTHPHHHHHHFYSTPPPPPPPAVTKPNSMWNNLDMEQINGTSTHHLMRNHHHTIHGHSGNNNLANNNHSLNGNNNNNNFGCSPVSSFLSGNLQMSI